MLPVLATQGADWSALYGLLAQAAQLIISLGAIFAELMVVILSFFGIALPETVARVITIVVDVLISYMFFSKVGTGIKLFLIFVLLALIISVFIGNYFGPGLFTA